MFKPFTTLWLCQNGYWKWSFIVSFPIENCDWLYIVMLIYKGVNGLHIQVPINHGISWSHAAPSHPSGRPNETAGCWVHLVTPRTQQVSWIPNKYHGVPDSCITIHIIPYYGYGTIYYSITTINITIHMVKHCKNVRRRSRTRSRMMLLLVVVVPVRIVIAIPHIARRKIA